MSIRLGVLKRHFSLSTLRTLPPSRVARFSQCAERFNQDASSRKPETPGTSRPAKEGDSPSDRKSRRRREGLVLPAFVLFAVGAPLGWMFKKRYDYRSQTHTADPIQFTKYKLVSKDNVSSTCAIFRLRPSSNVTIDLDDPALERAVTSIEFKQPQLQIARSYTCLPQEKGQHMDELRFLIRREQKGEVSNFLHKLPINSEIEVRGLHTEHVLPDDVKSVVFLAGGTGIAPALQTADIIDGQANMNIMWASRKREDCIGAYNDTPPSKGSSSWWSHLVSGPADGDRNIAQAEKGVLVAMLETLKERSASSSGQPPSLLVNYYVDEEGTSIQPELVKNALNALSRDNQDGRRIVFVSGPEGFINYWAGSKQWANGIEVQGPVRGVLSTMDLTGWEVVKL